jgi:sec-independent protein translocase protein TatB
VFDFTSSKLLIVGLVALMVIGPKDLPALLRTIGKYVGMIKRHANDFRAQFEEAMRESELAEIRKQVETATKEAEATMKSAEANIEKHLADAKAGTDPNDILGDPFAAPPTPSEPAPTLAASPTETTVAAPVTAPEKSGA